MALDYLRDVKPLEDAGKTDAQIATLFSAQTQVDMPSTMLRKYFHKNNLWLIDPATGLWSAGAIGAAYGGLTAPQKALVRKLWVWVYEQDSIETENDLDIAVEFKTIIDGMVSLSILTAANRNAIGSMAGGLRHGAQTAGDVVAARDAYTTGETEQARQDSIRSLQATIENTWINPAVSDGVSTAAQVQAAIKAGL